MPKQKNTLKDNIRDIALRIATRLDSGCSVYENRVYSEWNMYIEEDRRDDFLKSLTREKEYTIKKLQENEKFRNSPENPFVMVYKTICEIEKRI